MVVIVIMITKSKDMINITPIIISEHRYRNGDYTLAVTIVSG